MGGGQPLPVFFCFLLARRATRVEWGRLLSCYFYSIRWAVVAAPVFSAPFPRGEMNHRIGGAAYHPALLSFFYEAEGERALAMPPPPALFVSLSFFFSAVNHKKGGAA